MTATAAPERYELLRCPEAIPTGGWLRSSALWADSLSAIWPQNQPTPRNAGETAAMQDIVALTDAGLFSPKQAPDLSQQASRLNRRLGQLTSGGTSPWRAAWQLIDADAAAPGADEYATTLMREAVRRDRRAAGRAGTPPPGRRG